VVNKIERKLMRHADLYTKVILTVIAGLLAWNTLARFRIPAVHAQNTSSQYFVEQITTAVQDGTDL
jgi:hypothetical protein